MAKSGKMFYAVARGRNGPCVHNAWADCEADIKGFSNALYKGFPTAAEAESYLTIHETSIVAAASRPPKSASPKKPNYYAVAQGRNGAQIHSDWPSCAVDVTGYKGARFKSFATREEAEDYLRANAGVGQPRNVSRMPSLPNETAVKEEMENSNFQQRYTTVYAPRSEPEASGTRGHRALQKGVSSKRPMVHGVLPQKRAAAAEDWDDLLDERFLAEAEGEFDDESVGTSRKRQPPSWGSAVRNGDIASEHMRFTAASKVNGRDTSMQVPNSALAGFASGSPSTSTSVLLDTSALTTLPAPSLIDAPDEPPLSAEQQSILRRVQAGESIFFTGPAGTGKSVITRAIIRALKAQHGAEAVGVTATTGIAATNIGGCTLHSWAGAGLAKEKTEKIYWQIVKGNPKTNKRWSMCKALIIDEVSMLDGELFDKFEELGRMLRGNSRPFGGIQLVITGDLFQLPPVPDAYTYQGGPKKPVKFVFEAQSWSQCITSITVLTEIFRQKDATFVQLLNQLRLGQVTEEACATFKSLQRKVQYTDNIEPTVLHPKRASVLEENSRRLRALKTESLKFVASDSSGRRKEDGQPCFPDPARLKQVLDSSTLVEAEMELKINCQVMLVKNLADKTLVNGSVGKVIAFMTGDEVAATMFDVGTGDGQTLDGQPAAGASFTDSAFMPPGTSAAPPVLGNVNIAQAAPTEKEKLEQGGHPSERDERASIPPGRWPVVEFKGGKRMLLPPMSFILTNADGLEEATRVQVPLILAWALTIHKAQGQTLERVKVDVGDAFEKGQVYVALSRATQLETLQVLRFEKHRVNAHPAVIEYFKRLKQT